MDAVGLFTIAHQLTVTHTWTCTHRISSPWHRRLELAPLRLPTACLYQPAQLQETRTRPGLHVTTTAVSFGSSPPRIRSARASKVGRLAHSYMHASPPSSLHLASSAARRVPQLRASISPDAALPPLRAVMRPPARRSRRARSVRGASRSRPSEAPLDHNRPRRLSITHKLGRRRACSPATRTPPCPLLDRLEPHAA